MVFDFALCKCSFDGNCVLFALCGANTAFYALFGIYFERLFDDAGNCLDGTSARTKGTTNAVRFDDFNAFYLLLVITAFNGNGNAGFITLTALLAFFDVDFPVFFVNVMN